MYSGSWGKNVKLGEMKNEKNYLGFLVHKIFLKENSRWYIERFWLVPKWNISLNESLH